MPVLLIPRCEIPDRKKDTINPKMTNMSLEGAGQRVDASMVVQQVLSKLDNVVEHVSRRSWLDTTNTDLFSAAFQGRERRRQCHCEEHH